MKLRLVVAAMALLLVVVETERVEASCGNSVRIYHSVATCLSAEYSNDYNWIKLGYTYRVQNECSQYGMVAAKVDVKDSPDVDWTLNSSDKQGGTVLGKIDYIACCADKSELCYKNEVEQVGGYILLYAGQGTSYISHNVSTEQQRQAFCANYPNAIYCEVNPEGDAIPLPYNCGDHYCNVGDCEWNFRKSQASETCPTNFTNYDMSISAIDGSSRQCTIAVPCQTWSVAKESIIYYHNVLSAESWQMDELYNCDGNLRIGPC